jgi:hypothetical protein
MRPTGWPLSSKGSNCIEFYDLPLPQDDRHVNDNAVVHARV